MIDSDTKASLKQAIRRHLAENGPKDWYLIRQQFPGVPTGTLWRYVAKVKLERTPKAQLDGARAKMAEALAQASTDERRDAAAAIMPCIPSPAYIAKAGSEGMRHLDLLARLDGMLADLDRVRRCALNEAGDIVDPALFSGTIEVGIKLIGAAIKSIDAVYDQRRQISFYDAIVDEISTENPETAGRIIARLHQLDAERGYSFGGGVGGVAGATDGRSRSRPV